MSSGEPDLQGERASLKAHGGTRTAKGQTQMGKDSFDLDIEARRTTRRQQGDAFSLNVPFFVEWRAWPNGQFLEKSRESVSESILAK